MDEVLIWCVWLLLFILFESIVLLDHSLGDSFTEHLKKWLTLRTVSLEIREARLGMWLSRIGFLGFGVWLTCREVLP
jgi:hypothetical protein